MSETQQGLQGYELLGVNWGTVNLGVDKMQRAETLAF